MGTVAIDVTKRGDDFITDTISDWGITDLTQLEPGELLPVGRSLREIFETDLTELRNVGESRDKSFRQTYLRKVSERFETTGDVVEAYGELPPSIQEDAYIVGPCDDLGGNYIIMCENEQGCDYPVQNGQLAERAVAEVA